jgi:phenylalanyl-tRNA synthetase beta chain
LDLNWLDNFVGIAIPKVQIISILAGLGFSGDTTDDNSIKCIVPSWRFHDINIKEDLAEEIARIYGYFRLPSVLPHTATSPEIANRLLTTEAKAKNFLADIGFHEIYNSSLISLDLIDKTGLNPANHLKLQNALSSDYEYLRITLLPSLLQNLRDNQGKTDDIIKIFEIANCYLPQKNAELPQEQSTLSILTNDDFRTSKGHLEALFKHLNSPVVTFTKAESSPIFDDIQISSIVTTDGRGLGKIGKIKPQILRNFGITSSPVLVEINFVLLSELLVSGYTYHPLSEYPPITESITLETNTLVGDIMTKILSTDSLVINVEYTESYKNKHTFKVSFGSMERNLQQAEVNEIKKKILQNF